ncbi:MAG: hypothetical protein A2729_00285 [Candidatus Buchananbacteria bacterium RIFCSPHIGHO2_01_FULL_39_14]|uniref:HMA domain-containing protein n=1 Tax=Candidatus Buchananbacteria bacterium RIFCSPHIGHO2_01_FULL_39_14 TaxID=1797532 RepID=A0A1G1Y133_9BACT|nr:MAG: hypothetical protein A2729_00285 [Candidatus Buchananbacteria bacterium RIFCSPHIGHO2_01_FULL_39_14]OGY48759.1 MAG: hypothetical protein A3D39_04820 [Candidatus Buchananbacteria bacterium RIFCSPHIGHO2_02_FULL_39_17]
MAEQNLEKIKVKIAGMHCASCEVLIERQFLSLEGVNQVFVRSGKAVIYCSTRPSVEQLQQAITPHGYHLTALDGQKIEVINDTKINAKKDYFQIGAIFLLVMAGYLLLKQFNFISTNFGITEQMGYGFVFLVGLVASISTCLAVTGGLLLAVSTKYNAGHPELSSSQKIKPLLYFNGGRLIGYAVLGGLVGALGSVLTFSPKVSGVITILASLAMIILGLQLLHLFPGLQRFPVRLPKILAHKIHDLSSSDSKLAPFSLGALTFFLPCGFTQALQLYVLTQGGAFYGALIMFFFALGTLPALLSISILSALIKGKVQNYILKFAGVTAVLLGLFSMQNGLVLAGNPLGQVSQNKSQTVLGDPNVQMIDGRQVVKMKINYLDYYPARFTVQRGVPVEWVIDAAKASGCMSSLLVPGLGIREYLPRTQPKKITFIPSQTGTYGFSCAMGMGTPGAAIIVVDSPNDSDQSSCDVTYADCLKS